VEILGEIACGDADIPSEGFPLSPFVVRQSACRHCVNGLSEAGGFGCFQKKLKDPRFAGTCRRIDDHIRAAFQVTHRILLPEIRQIQGSERNLETCGVQNPRTSGWCAAGSFHCIKHFRFFGLLSARRDWKEPDEEEENGSGF
jgi:hypothetical protein